jgi:hypothetical protein
MSVVLQKGRLSATLGWDLRNVTGGGTTVDAGQFSYSRSLTQGTGAGGSQEVYRNTFSIAGAGNQTYDLAGSLVDAFGNVITFSHIQGLYIELSSGGATSIHIGGGSDGAGANAFINWISSGACKLRVRSGGVLFLATNDAVGYPVTGGTGDILRIENEDGSNAANGFIALLGV